MRPLRVRFAQVCALILLPGVARADELLTPVRIFGDAAPFQKLIILAVVVSSFAAIGIAGAKMARPQSTAGSSFVSGLRLGGPLLGLLGAAYSMLSGFIGIANLPITPSLRVVAPGVAESLFVLCLGVLAGVVAVIAQWAIDARPVRAART